MRPKLSRLKDELKRKKEEIKQAEAKKAEEERLRKEAQRKLDAVQKSRNKPHIKIDYEKVIFAVFIMAISLWLLLNDFVIAALAVYYSWYFFVYKS